jgi:MraZ protein
MDRFFGNIDAKTDVKGRVFVPASFRKIFQSGGDSRLILRKDVYQECLVLYPESVWNEELTAMRTKLDKWDPEQQMLYRQFQLETEILELDSIGRILIPKRYLQDAGIVSEVRFVGMDYTMEIWAKQKVEKPLLDKASFQNGMQKWMTGQCKN